MQHGSEGKNWYFVPVYYVALATGVHVHCCVLSCNDVL